MISAVEAGTGVLIEPTHAYLASSYGRWMVIKKVRNIVQTLGGTVKLSAGQFVFPINEIAVHLLD